MGFHIDSVSRYRQIVYRVHYDKRGTPQRIMEEGKTRIWQTQIPERAPLMAWLISCVFLTFWNLSRGLDLWAGYNFGGAVMALLAILILWSGRAHIPALPLWIGYSATMLLSLIHI